MVTHADRLTRTPGSAGNRRTNTFSMWIKRANPLETYQTVFLQSDDAGAHSRTSSINFQTEDNGSGNLGRIYSAIMVDWISHCILLVDLEIQRLGIILC